MTDVPCSAGVSESTEAVLDRVLGPTCSSALAGAASGWGCASSASFFSAANLLFSTALAFCFLRFIIALVGGVPRRVGWLLTVASRRAW